MESIMKQIPHPVVLLVSLLFLVALASQWVPTGQFDRIEVDGRQVVVPGTFEFGEQQPLDVLATFLCLPKGFKGAVDILFIIFSSGILFGFLQKSGALVRWVGRLVLQAQGNRAPRLVLGTTLMFGLLGMFVGYENNIALVPIAVVLSTALGGDRMLAASMSVGGITIGFGFSPFNPYTVGTAHKIAGLPLFSGFEWRLALCMVSLGALMVVNWRYFQRHRQTRSDEPSSQVYPLRPSDWLHGGLFVGTMGIILWGVFQKGWYLNELSAVFCMTSLVYALIGRYSHQEIGDTVLQSVATVAPGAFLVGLAGSIKVALETSQMQDTLAYFLSQGLSGLDPASGIVGMTFVQSLMNFLIPSGSGQALATLPIMIPLGEILGITRQSTILAFQIGDGLTNLVNPAFGGIIAMLSLCEVSFSAWLRFIFPLFGVLLGLALLFAIGSVWIGYGPF